MQLSDYFRPAAETLTLTLTCVYYYYYDYYTLWQEHTRKRTKAIYIGVLIIVNFYIKCSNAAMFGNACSDLIQFYCSQAWYLRVCVSIHENMWLAGRLRPVFCASPRGMQVKAISVPWKPARCAFLHPESWWADSFLIGSSSDTRLLPNLQLWQPPHHQASHNTVHMAAVTSDFLFYQHCSSLGAMLTLPRE